MCALSDNQGWINPLGGPVVKMSCGPPSLSTPPIPKLICGNFDYTQMCLNLQ